VLDILVSSESDGISTLLRWELHGVGLDRHPYGSDEANDPELRCNPANKS